MAVSIRRARPLKHCDAALHGAQGPAHLAGLARCFRFALRRRPAAVVALMAGLLAGGSGYAQEAGGLAVSSSDWSERQWEAGADADSPAATPSHIDRAVQELIAEIGVLRDEFGVLDFPSEGELQVARAPVHVYAKTQELLGKVRRIQTRFGVSPAAMRPIPFKRILRDDVLRSVEGLLEEVRRVQSQLGIERADGPSRLVPGKRPMDVYASLARASGLLDGLLGQSLTPDEVYENASLAAAELQVIAAGLGVPVAIELPVVEAPKCFPELAQQALAATRQAINLERRLGMEASRLPSLTLVRVTPTEVHDVTNALLAELARIKLHAGIDVRRVDLPTPTEKTPEDVFALMSLITENLGRVLEATTEATVDELEARRQAEREEQEAERQRQAEAEAERQRELELQRQAEEAERQRELERQQQEAEAARLFEIARQEELERQQRQAEAEQLEAEPQAEAEVRAAGDQAAEVEVGQASGPEVDEPRVDDLQGDDPASDAPVGEAPVSDAPVVDDPMVVDPVADGPVADDPTVDEDLPPTLPDERDAPALAQPEAERPLCELRIAERARSLMPGYPGGGRRDFGNAEIMVSFAVDEFGETIDETVVADRENSNVERMRSFDRFASVAVEAVRSWSLEFEDPNDTECDKFETRAVVIRFRLD